MACGRKSKPADGARIDMPFASAGANGAHGLENIAKRGRMTVILETIFQNQCGDAERVEPARHRETFFLHGEVAMATARANFGRRMGRWCIVGDIGSQRGYSRVLIGAL